MITYFLRSTSFAALKGDLLAAGIATGDWDGRHVLETEAFAILYIGQIYDPVTLEPVNELVHANLLLKTGSLEITGKTEIITPETPYFTFFL